MNLYEDIINFLQGSIYVQQWPEMQTLLHKAAARQPAAWELPLVASEAVCGQRHMALPAAAAVACLQISILLIDDMLDEDPRGEHHRLGTSATTNLAAAFQAAGLEAISMSKARPTERLRALEILNQMIFTTAIGQHWDVKNPKDELGYWKLVQTKSSPFFSAALGVGAVLGGGSTAVVQQVCELGALYGEIIQIHDDLHDSLNSTVSPDWLLGRLPLPILYAELVNHPWQTRFQALRSALQNATAQTLNPQELEEAQTILIRSGAVSYALAHLVQRYHKARALLTNTQWASQSVEQLIEATIAPVRELFTLTGTAVTL